MNSILYISLLDNSNKSIEKISIEKPKTLKELNIQLKTKLKRLPNNYYIFYLSQNNNEIIINTNKEYNLSNDILFIRESELNLFIESAFQINYKKLSESKQDILDDKYYCLICNKSIKNENPFFCYICQKIFHNQCLINWDKKKKEQNENLDCPNCRNELPFERWKQKLNYEEDRTNAANLMNKISQNQLIMNLNDNINIIKDEKINRLEKDNMKKNELIEKYNKFCENIFDVFKKLINKINLIISLIESKIDVKINELIKELNSNIIDFPIENLSNLILDNLKIIEKYIQKKKNFYLINENKLKNKIEKIKEISDEKDINNILNPNYKNIINLVYFTIKEDTLNIFGEKFVQNNKMNIDLIINSKKSELVKECKLKKGKNNIKIIIKNRLTNISYMFCDCYSLLNIEDLKYLDTKEIKNFQHIFFNCILLSDITSLQYWNVSNGNNFESIFTYCNSLKNIKPLENWNLSKANNISSMFYSCESLSNINPLQNWNVSNIINFSHMFYNCKLLSDISPLKDWNISHGINFCGLFRKCKSLSDIRPLENWNISNGINFSHIFNGCTALKDISPLKNWNIINCKNFEGMFNNCISLSNLKPLQNWNLSNGNNFSGMFRKCVELSDVNPIQKCNVSNGNNFQSMFYNCSSLKNIKPLEKWNISKYHFDSLFE